MNALFGPGGNSNSFYAEGFKHSHQAPAWVKSKGLDAYEYQGGNGIRGSRAAFEAIGQAAKDAGVLLSVHAPYYISLSGVDPEKRLKSLDYIRQSLEAAEAMGADTVVIHTGSASKISRAEAVALAKDTMYKALESIPNPAGIRLGLETMGKENQLGTLHEVIDICTVSPQLYPVVDFGHLNAREQGNVFPDADAYMRVFDEISSALGADKAETLHCHFSRIEYTAAGEKKHLTFADEVFGPDHVPLMEAISRLGVSPRIICESDGTMAEDALTMKQCYMGLK